MGRVRHSLLVALQLAIFAAAVALPVALLRIEGGVAFMWAGTALLIAKLAATPRDRWPAVLIVCGAISAVITATVGVGPAAAIPLAFANVGEAVLAMELMRRWNRSGHPSINPRDLASFVVAGGFVAPLASGLVGALVVTLVTGTGFLPNLFAWVAGHALGSLALTPIAAFALSGQIVRWAGHADAHKRVEAVAILTLLALTTGAVFAQSSKPLLFLPWLPLMLATFRLGRFGAALGIVVIALIAGISTAMAAGPIILLSASTGAKVQFLQFYLASTTLLIMPVAVSLAHRKRLYQRLLESEARYRLVTDNSTDIVLNLDLLGRIRFVSPSISQFGHRAEDLIGVNAGTLVDAAYRPAVRDVHLQAISDPGRTFIISYAVTVDAGVTRWFESHTRCVRGEDGEPAGVVTSVRDITHRKAIEQRLEHAANTDPLTGLANRRHLQETLEALTDRSGPLAQAGCVAIFDIDHFKSINDNFGHAAGDRVLTAFAAIARTVVRDGDLVSRIGGEEFALVLPGATTSQAMLVCDRLRTTIAERSFDIGAARPVRLTVSGGVTSFARGDGSDAILRAADTALYRAKAEGRDRLSLAA